MPELLTLDGLDMRQAHMGVSTRTGRYSVPSARGDGLVLPGRSGYVFTPNRPLEAGLGALNCWCVGANSTRVTLEKNLLLNPSFETGTALWSPIGATVTAVSTPWSAYGVQGMAVSNTVAGYAGYFGGVSSGAYGVPVVPGEIIGASISAKATKPLRLLAYMYYLNAAGTNLGGASPVNLAAMPDFAAGEVKSVSIWFPAAPATAAFAQVFWYLYEPGGTTIAASTGEYLVVDASRIENIGANGGVVPSTRVLSLSSGLTPGWSWDGTPHASTSALYDYDISLPSTPAGRRKALEANLGAVQRLFSRKHRLATLRAQSAQDGTIRRAFVEFTELSDPTIQAAGTRAEFNVEYTIPSVFWEDELTRTQAATVGTSTPKNLDLTLFDSMTGLIEDGVITVAGPVSNPRVTDAETGAYVEYSGTVPNGQSWVIDSGAFTSKVNGTSVINSTKHVGSYRLLVIPNCFGTSSTPRLVLTGTSFGAATNLSVTARRKWFSA